MKKWGVFLGLIGLMSVSGFGQTLFSGQVLDGGTGEELIGANVILYQSGRYVQGTSTDFNGDYKMSIDPGIYDVEVSYIGYPTQKTTGVVIEAEQENKLTIQMESGNDIIACSFCYIIYTIPLIERGCASSGKKMGHWQIENRGDKNIGEMILNVPGISF